MRLTAARSESTYRPRRIKNSIYKPSTGHQTGDIITVPILGTRAGAMAAPRPAPTGGKVADPVDHWARPPAHSRPPSHSGRAPR